MKYYEIEININPCTDATRALMTSFAADAGCEAFEDTKTGVMAYVQQTLFDQQALDESINSFPISDTTITYKVREAEDKDWNEQWEQEGFEPIVVADKLVIHDGRHLPSAISLQPSAISIEIDAHLAFGTGTRRRA